MYRVPAGSMEPTIRIGDHIVVQKSAYGWTLPMTRIPMGAQQLPDRGDIIIFVYPGSDEGPKAWADLPGLTTIDYIKRVIGLPGDTVAVQNGIPYINGEPVVHALVGEDQFMTDRCLGHPVEEYTEMFGDKQHHIYLRTSLKMLDYPPTAVPDGHLFVLGDNRDHSADSRVWGFVPVENVKGRAATVWSSYSPCDEAERSDRSRMPLH